MRICWLLLLWCAGTLAAAASDFDEQLDFSIPSQSLTAALLQFAEQSKIQVLTSSSELSGYKTRGVQGRHTARAALEAILSGTDLQFRKVGEGTVTISSGAQSQPSAARDTRDARFQLAQSGNAAFPASGVAGVVQPERSAVVSIEQITVTGSRLARPAFDMPTPVSVLDSDQIQQSGFNNIGDVLNQLPSIGLGLSSGSGQFSNDAGAAFVNLRGLGTARTLVLIDGRRRVSGSSDSSAVDLSTIPASMIERVEIITGGASAVYGADAVSGVINVILKDDFNGLELSAQRGISEHGGAETLAVSAFGGISVADGRGSLNFAISHDREEPMFSNQRSFADSWVRNIGNPLNTGPGDGIPDFITAEDFRFAVLNLGSTFDVGGTYYTIDPQLRPLQYDPQTGMGLNGDGWDFSRYFQQRMRSEVTSFRSNFKFRFTDRVSLFAQSEFSSGDTFSSGAPTYDFGTVIQRDNPFISADLGTLMDANGVTELGVIRASVDQGIVSNDNSRFTYTIASGLKGEFGKDWAWQVFGQYGRYDLTNRSTNRRWNSRYLEAIDAIADPLTGAPICRSESARAAGCQPINILGANTATAGALNYFRVDSTLDVENTQVLAGAQLTGTLFELPAGPLSSAVGVEYRKDTRSYQSDPLAEAGLLLDRPSNTSLTGDDAVTEAFVEVVAPLLRDQPFSQLLQVEGAARFSDYESIGSTTAWKLGATWAPVRSLKFRGTRSQSVRAPNLYELFSPATSSIQGLRPENDPCDASKINSGGANRAANCLALGVPAGWAAPVISESVWTGGGNLRLQEETSTAWTAGFVFSPEWAAGLSVSVDYWNIEIEKAVQSLDGVSTLNKCVDAASIDNVFCSRITRDATDNHIAALDLSYINIGALSAEGVDFQAAYLFEAADAGLPIDGRLSIVLTASYLALLEQLVDSTDPDSVLVQDGQYDNPTWRANLSLGYAGQALRVNLNTRMIGKARVDLQSSLETYDRPRVGAKVYNDLIFGYDLGERYEARFGINNLFDVEPPATAQTYLGMYTLYDSIGRFFTLGATAKF